MPATRNPLRVWEASWNKENNIPPQVPIKNVCCNLSISQLHPGISCDFYHLAAWKVENMIPAHYSNWAYV